jgi:hypothetical protein
LRSGATLHSLHSGNAGRCANTDYEAKSNHKNRVLQHASSQRTAIFELPSSLSSEDLVDFNGHWSKLASSFLLLFLSAALNGTDLMVLQHLNFRKWEMGPWLT